MDFATDLRNYIGTLGGCLVVVLSLAAVTGAVCELINIRVMKVVEKMPWWPSAQPLQKGLMMNFGFAEDDCTPEMMLEGFSFVLLICGHHFLMGMAMVPVVVRGWSGAGPTGQLLFLMAALGDVSFDVYDTIKKFLLTFFPSTFKSWGTCPLPFFIIMCLLHHPLAMLLVIPMNMKYSYPGVSGESRVRTTEQGATNYANIAAAKTPSSAALCVATTGGFSKPDIVCLSLARVARLGRQKGSGAVAIDHSVLVAVRSSTSSSTTSASRGAWRSPRGCRLSALGAACSLGSRALGARVADMPEYHKIACSLLLAAGICFLSGQYKFTLDVKSKREFLQYKAIVLVQFVTIWYTRCLVWFPQLYYALSYFRAQGDTHFLVGGCVAGGLMSLFNVIMLLDATTAALKWLPRPLPDTEGTREELQADVIRQQSDLVAPGAPAVLGRAAKTMRTTVKVAVAAQRFK
ncbi:unnamed protein product, partial [Prorocentrum cordatum]